MDERAALTPAGFLFLRALEAGKTTLRESGKGIKLEPQPGETVLLFRTDTPEFRERFGIGKNEQASDAMALYLKPAEARHALLFVELKGADYRHAVAQLERVILAVRETLPPLLGEGLFTEACALIVSNRASPPDFGLEIERFFRATKIRLRTVTSGTADLREVLKSMATAAGAARPPRSPR